MPRVVVASTLARVVVVPPFAADLKVVRQPPMRFSNFDLRYPQGVEVVGLGHNWDLHNFAFLSAHHYDRDRRVCEFEWAVPRGGNPWGDPSNSAVGCRLRLTGVSRYVVEGEPPSGGAVLAELGSIPPEGNDKRFDLWFLFEDGSLVKVAGDAAELVPLAPAA